MSFAARRLGPLARTVVVSALIPATFFGQILAVRLDSGALRVSAPKLHFLAGKTLDQLQNGASVIFAAQLTLLTDGKLAVRHRDTGRFALSYDLWEEKFSVTRLGNPRRSASHLTVAAAESWCLENVTVPVTGVAESTPFWVRLDLRAEENGLDFEEDSALSLTRLVELFSRPPPQGRPQWREEAGPLRLTELKKP